MQVYYKDEVGELWHGDCLEVMSALAMLGERVDAVITDPPFSSGTRREASKGLRKSMTRSVGDTDWFGSDCLTTNGFLWLMRACAHEWKQLLTPGGHVLSFIDWRMYPALCGAIESADLRHAGMLVWNKTYFGMGSCFRNQHELILHFTHGKGVDPQRRDVGNVIDCKPVRNGVHPTEKPVALLETLLSVVVPKGGTVLDPFAGSGSVAEAAVATGRRWLAIEAEEEYCEIIANRAARLSPG